MRLDEISNRVNPGAMQEIKIEGDNWQPLKEFMLKNCSTYLNVLKTGGIYGRNLWHSWGETQVPEIFLGKSLQNRASRQATAKQQASLDEKLAALGCKALRSNSLFCIGSREAASEFGYPCKIFPLNGFSFTAIQFEKDSRGDSSRWWIPTDYSDMPLDEFKNLNKFNNSRLDLAIASGRELWINGRFLSFTNYDRNTEFLDELLDAL